MFVFCHIIIGIKNLTSMTLLSVVIFKNRVATQLLKSGSFVALFIWVGFYLFVYQGIFTFKIMAEGTIMLSWC